MGAGLVIGETIQVAAAAPLFEAGAGGYVGGHMRYDVAPDGRFLMREQGIRPRA